MFEYKGYISKIVDGDTFICNVDLGFNVWIHERFRLKDVLVPEKREDLDAWDEMKRFAEEKFYIKPVTIKTHKLDKYGRYVAELFQTDGVSINDKITAHIKEYLDDRANK